MRILGYMAALFLAAAPAAADVFQWNFSGTVNDDVVASLFPLAPGTAFSGSISVNTNVPSHLGDLAFYPGFLPTIFDPGSAIISVDLGSLHIAESAHIVLLDSFDPSVFDELDLVPDGLGPFDTHVTFRYFDLSDQAIGGGAFPNGLPLAFPRFADIAVTGAMFLPDPYAPPWIYQFTGQVDMLALAPFPEPASWAMMLTGFGLVGGALRNRRRSSAIA